MWRFGRVLISNIPTTAFSSRRQFREENDEGDIALQHLAPRNVMQTPTTILRVTAERHSSPDLQSVQLRQPVFLTNHSCEPAVEDPQLLDALGLPHDPWNGEFYPLTRVELARNAEEVVDTRLGPFLTGYVVLFRGEKWFAPLLEAHFRSEANAYDPSLPSRAERLAELTSAAEQMHPVVQALGGHLVLTLDDCLNDRHSLQILLSTTTVCNWCPDPGTFAALITAIVGPGALLPALAAVDGDHGDYFVIDLLTDDGGHVASVTCWNDAGAADKRSVAHASQLRAAGPIYEATCSLIRAYLEAHGIIHSQRPPRPDSVLTSALGALARARGGLDPR